VDAYAELRSTVNELTGRINSQHGSPTGSPIQLLYRSVNNDELLALYRAADVMMVTPLRDGMNLVAKEYVASRIDDAGVLVLSEFAGAAAELEAALIVNPYDIAGTATMLRRALFMSEGEQRVRMRRLRAHVEAHPVSDWARSFIDELSTAERTSFVGFSVVDELNRAVERLRSAPHRTFLFDYDGTLVPLAPLPELAAPDEALYQLLEKLTQLPNTEVHIVSGRSRKSLEEWLGTLPLWLHVEHGFASRDKLGNWREATQIPSELLSRAQEIVRVHVRRTPGARMEIKSASIAFHFRGADPHLAEARLRVLRSELSNKLGPEAELLDGHKVLEVRIRGVHKGTVLQQIAASVPRASVLFAAGDDRTDEDLFAAVPEDAITVRVGPGASRARLRLPGPFELRRLLNSLFS
jgi:trehalose 6-phosphate synthase/phosphatase